MAKSKQRYRNIYFFLLFLLISVPFLAAQEIPTAGFIDGTNGYIGFLPGNMPLVISIPHGGYLMPDEIPERPCVNCSKNQDIFTLEIGMGIRDAIFRQTGHYPYVIINNLHRTRLDPNRNISEASDGNKNAELVWHQFQNCIDSACSEVESKFGKGLYIDLHGHRHLIKRTELGYLLSNEELQLEDELLDLDSFVEFSSIKSLVDNNLNRLSFSQLIRGKDSFGSLFEAKGYPTVPSRGIPFPDSGEPYFSGGYNTTRHGSSQGGTIDGIQIELDEELRRDMSKRDKLVADLACTMVEFLKIHYFPDADFLGEMAPGNKQP
jgi:hypothetical protein